MYPDDYVPAAVLEQNGHAVWSLEREIDRVASMSQTLGAADVDELRRCANRLLALITDLAERRAA